MTAPFVPRTLAVRDGTALVLQPFRPGEPVYLHEVPADGAPLPDPSIRPAAEGGRGADRVGDFTFGVRSSDGTARWEVGVVDANGWTVFENPLKDRYLRTSDGTTRYVSMEGFDYDDARYVYRMAFEDDPVDPTEIADPRYHAVVERWRAALERVDRGSSSLADPSVLGDPDVRAPYWMDVAVHEDDDARYVPTTERNVTFPVFYRLPRTRWPDVRMDDTFDGVIECEVAREGGGVVDAVVLDPDTRRGIDVVRVELGVDGRLKGWDVGPATAPPGVLG